MQTLLRTEKDVLHDGHVLYFIVSSELMQQRQRVGDLEEELELLRKQLQTTQMKVVQQVKDFYLQKKYY